MPTIIVLRRAEAHLFDKPVAVNVDHIDSFSPNVMEDNQTLLRVNGKEFVVRESFDTVLNMAKE